MNLGTVALEAHTKAPLQEMKLETDINKCINLIKSEDIHLIDVEGMTRNFKENPSLGDLLQYELHIYCKKNMKIDSNVNFVVKLAEVCYSKHLVAHFTRMDRFVGCVYYICSYLLKNAKYKEAIDISYSLDLKKEELTQSLKYNSDIFNFLYTVHTCFMTSAITLASQAQNNSDSSCKYSLELAVLSLKFFQFNNAERLEFAKKIIKKSKLYLHSIKYYSDEDFNKFYGTLKSIMKTLLPKFCHFEFCSYFLFNIDHLKNLDYSKGMSLFQQLKKTTQLFMILSNFSLSVRKNFDSLLNFFFISPLENTNENCEIIHKCIRCDGQKEKLLFLLISIIFHHGIQYWWKLFEDDWSVKVSSEMLKKFITKILELLNLFHSNESLYCTSTKIPCEACFGDLLTGNLQKIQYTIRLCLKNKIPKCTSLVSLSREAFQLSIKCVDVMRTMSCCKMQSSYAWKFAVIHHTNLIEDIIRLPPTSESWTDLRDCSHELLREIVNSDFELPYDAKRVNVLFQRWHQSALKLKKFNDGLFVCVVFYLCCPTEEASVMSMWLQTKSECGNEIFQEMTISEVLKNCESAIKEFYPKLNRHQIDMKAILLLELKAYSSRPEDTFKDFKTSYNVVSRIWKQLEKLDLDLWEKSFALTCLLLTNIAAAGSNGKLPVKISEKCKDTINELSSWTFKEKLQCRSFVYAGNLQFCLFLYNLKLAESSEGSMDANEMVLGYLKKAEEEMVKFGEDVDVNLTCNVVPSSSHLTVELENNYLNDLNEIVEIWQRALKHGFDELPTPVEFDTWLQNVQLVAYLYELYGEYHSSLSAWLLFYKIGKLCNDSASILLGLTQVIENCSDIDKSELLKESNSIAIKLDSENKGKDVLIVYWLAVASNHLKNKRPTKCLEHLSKARKLLEGLRTSTKTHTLNAKFWCLVSQFLTYYPKYEVELGYRTGTDLRIIAFKAFNYAVAGARSSLSRTATQVESTELVLVMLKVNMWAYHFHEIYSQTDFMRFFLDDVYQIVQKLFLPTRTAEILARLAEVDLICEKAADCQEKVSKLKCIFTSLLSKPNKASELQLSPISTPEEYTKKTLRSISPARFLEKPNDLSQMSDTSPIHYHLNNVKYSNQVKHKTKCKCRLCQNLLIQILTMNTLTLEAEIFNLENNVKNAMTCYSEAYKIFSKLEHLRGEKSELICLEVVDTLKSHSEYLDFMVRPVQFYSTRFLLNYSLFESTISNTITDSMKNSMEIISKLMRKFSYEQKLLMWKFVELKLLRVVIAKEKEIKRKETPEIYESLEEMKTPLMRHVTATTSRKKPLKGTRSPSTVKSLDVSSSEENKSNDEKNTAFMGPENLPTNKKLTLRPRKLTFRASELATTVKKTPKVRLNNMKPKKLNLDDLDS